MNESIRPTRRQALAGAVCAVACSLLTTPSARGESPARDSAPASSQASTQPAEPIIDIHQHTTYLGRSDEDLLRHQQVMGVSQTILLSGGTPVNTASTLKGRANGLYAGAGTADTCIPFAERYPHVYYFGANEVPDLPEARQRIEDQLKRGAVIIGEQKFNLPVDSKEMELIYSIAQAHDVPVLMHFQYEMFNTGYENFGKVLAKWPKVNFIGHAQTFWANIDANYTTPKNMYPKGKVAPGGLTDRYLRDYPNFWGDMSAGSGLNAMTRDEEHARGFLERHQDRLLYGSDCADRAGQGPKCSGWQQIQAIRRLAPTRAIARKIFFENAKGLIRLT